MTTAQERKSWYRAKKALNNFLSELEQMGAENKSVTEQTQRYINTIESFNRWHDILHPDDVPTKRITRRQWERRAKATERYNVTTFGESLSLSNILRQAERCIVEESDDGLTVTLDWRGVMRNPYPH